MSEQLRKDIGERIRTGRNLLNYSQEKLAELADLSKQSVCSAENGQQELRATNIVSIAHALGTSTDYLLKGEIVESDLVILDKQALGLSEKQLTYLKKWYLDFIKYCKEVESIQN